ncbi:MAG: hypothetical protein KME07_17375 [Pegethrix bostrychoides GSE-TBD4-15B]|jgi:hypothetical protein|uniref:Lipoprotein n=1 Tax=Pegethrix bostrychoides GSE-TBD4-15B TaxID=2839662 RepID=A0A951PDJ9_9CYAN|nr:hypothetical protein [Pegethrix bostrychoides GSE-TBD4-15B]
MKYLHPIQMLMLGLMATLATSCDSLTNLLSDGSTPTDQAPADPAAPGAATSAPRQNASCTTANYFAKVVWQGDQPTMTFGRKPDQTTLNNAPAVLASNSDGSITYRADGEAATYVRLYPNNSCFVQVVQAENQVVLEETGTVGS